jgi:hypothetical protein
MRFRWLKDSATLTEYRRAFASRGGDSVSMEYLENAKVRAVFQGSKMVGGYVLNSKQPFRYTDGVPLGEKRDALVSRCANAVEITCIWMDPDMRALGRDWVYGRMISDALFVQKRWVIGGSCIPRVAKIQKQVIPHTIYHGPLELPGNPIEEVYRVHFLELAFRMTLAFIGKTSLDLVKTGWRACWRARHHGKGRLTKSPTHLLLEPVALGASQREGDAKRHEEDSEA